MTAIDKSIGSAYADLGYADADSMRLKADLALAIGDLIAARRLTQSEAATLLGMTQPKVSAMLRGQFRVLRNGRIAGCAVAGYAGSNAACAIAIGVERAAFGGIGLGRRLLFIGVCQRRQREQRDREEFCKRWESTIHSNTLNLILVFFVTPNELRSDLRSGPWPRTYLQRRIVLQ